MIPRLKGTDDILPPDSERWRRLLRAFDELAERYGYDLAVMPAIESTELFARGVGESTEVVEKQMYTFTDRGGRSVTLRPEFTAGMVRAYVDSGASGVLKLAASGPQFRYERPQRGRRRQFFQVDLEYLGEPGPNADVEVIEFSHRLLTMLEVPAPLVLLNSIGDPADRAAYRVVLLDFLAGVEKQLSPDARRRLADNPLRVLDSKADAEVVAEAPVPLEHLGEGAASHFARVRAGLESLGVPYSLAPRLVRGLDYYNRTVFELVSPGFEAAQASLGGGGRYDPLAEMIGADRPVPAVGVALGCDRIVAAMPGPGSGRLDLFVALADPEQYEEAERWVSGLRARGLRVDWSPGGSLKSQFRAADRCGAAVAAVVGGEWNAGEVTVKDLTTGEQSVVEIEEVLAWLQRR